MAKINRKKLILEEAARLFSAKRFDEVLMDDIAHQAGVGKGTIYTYFADKEELYFAVVFEGIRRLNEQLQRKANRQQDPEKELRRMVHAIVSFFSQNRFFFRLMSQEDGKSEGGRGENRKRWREERRIQLTAIETVLQNGAEEGVFSVENPKVEAAILRDMVRSVMIHSRGLNVEAMVDTIMRIFLQGVRKKP
ncbi:MAG: TetR/AcrR family transcriptional regulator [Gemmatimonadota bacterium]|nr:TetR/AcrR family transcriptional regulator [Gemmatimonadota bacterium]